MLRGFGLDGMHWNVGQAHDRNVVESSAVSVEDVVRRSARMEGMSAEMLVL